MKNICIFISIFILFICSCTKTVYVPTQTKIETIIKDSLIYIKDTIYITPPVEEKEVKTTADSSHLETSLAISDAWIDKDGDLNHTLKNKTDTVYRYVYDTVVVTQIEKEYIEKPVIQEVKVDVPYIPKWCWLCVVFTVGVIIYIIVKIWLKFKVV